jgi:hypothetical protein
VQAKKRRREKKREGRDETRRDQGRTKKTSHSLTWKEKMEDVIREKDIE